MSEEMNEYKEFAQKHQQEYNSLLARFNSGDATLSQDEVKRLYYAEPFVGNKPNDELVATANGLYDIADYRVAYHMYLRALEQAPTSLLLLKKAANCSRFAVMGVEAALKSRINMLQEALLSTGDGKSAETAIKVIRTSDEYQLLYDVCHVHDVLGQAVAGGADGWTIDDLTVTVAGDDGERHVFFSCYGETEAQMQDFFQRKKKF